jgi:formamidopyrimidine-DNA glycosylase
MPELPDVELYIEQLARRTVGRPLVHMAIAKPFVLRSVDPAPGDLEGHRVTGVRRLGKRIVIELEGELFIVIHLMIAGRLRWRDAPTAASAPVAPPPPADGGPRGRKSRRAAGAAPAIPARMILATLEFPDGRLVLTEAGTTRRASIHLVRGDSALAAFDRGGLEVLAATLSEFTARLRSENHTLKRTLTDPRLFSGIGNAYSDEILHRARLSPLALTAKLPATDVERLFEATRAVLTEWTARLRAEVGDGFPETVTAFREGMAVHGRFGQPCPACQAPVQRIRYASNETNYCARCQTGGRLLADRGLSRLLKQDWPRSIDDIE